MADWRAGNGPADERDLRSYLAAVMDSANDAIVGLTVDGIITSWNAAAERLFGHSAEEIVGRPFRDLVPEARAPQLQRVIGRVWRGESMRDFATRAVRKDGTVCNISMSASPIRDRDGTVIGAASATRGLTEEDRQRSYRAAIVESSDDAVVGLGLDGTITSWNAGAERLYGQGADDMIGSNVDVLFTEDLAGDWQGLLRRVGEGQALRDYQTKAVRSDGTEVDLSMSVSAVRDPSGSVIGAASVSRDISERIRADSVRWAEEQQRQQAQRIETVAQVTGGVAHDFNNLLSAIMGYGGLVADATAGDVHEDAEQILRAAQRGSWLARALLIFDQRAPASPEPLEVNQALTQARPLLSANAGDRVTLRFETAPLPPVLCDRGQFEQMLLNLAVNARDAMPEGGTLTVATRAIDAGAWHGENGDGAGSARWVEITVSDTGCGMSPVVARHAFEPFFTTKPQSEGTGGLGLAAVWNIVTGAGGTVSVESEEGMGTTFRVYMPAAEVPAVSGAPPQSALPRGRGERVLVADDDRSVLAVTSRILRGNGYTTLEASNLEQVLSALSSRSVQLLLTDSVMPGMGATFTDRVRELEPGLRIMHMSGYNPPTMAGENIEFIAKPFTSDALLEKVRVVLDTPAG